MDALQINIGGEKDQKERRNLFLYSAGKTVSTFGTAIFNFAVGLYVLKLTGSALSFAVTLILGIIPMVVIGPFAGVIADKFNKKVLAVSMDLLNGILLVFVYILCIQYELNLIIIYATTFLLTVFTTFFGVGVEAAKPNIVSEKRLMPINSISKIIDSVSSILGPMLGGLVFIIFDIRTFIILNGISFVISGLLMMFIDFKLFTTQANEDDSTEKIRFTKEMKEGFHYLFGKKNVMNLIINLISINFFLGFSMTVPLPYIMNTVLKLSPKEFGIIQGAFPIGMILGALVVKKLTERVAYSNLLRYLNLSLATLMIISGIPVLLKSLEMNSIVYVCFYSSVMLFLGVSLALIDIPISFFMQKEIPDEYRGRVLSIGISTVKTMLPLAIVLSGVLLNYVPSYIMPIVGGMLFLLLNMRPASRLSFELTSENIKA
ncbi:MFS transporter [Microbacteriaceae bacterium 4G12]